MSYQALYRRYRPALFSDFVGQDAIIRTLKNQVMSGRIAHAYLFCGTRGTGKTSAAKVLARAVNCTQPQDGEPCGTRAVCRALSQESNFDILEIDAASNNSVDNIRDLQEQVKYPPQLARYRVYIIDEVHMLSAGAFNALLKTLEEPPSHIIFILATTEPQKLPATILSRCQRYDFRRISAEQIVSRLRVALRDAALSCEDAALMRIARAAQGAMRDAWSILDMCMGYAQQTGSLTLDLVTQVLGAADSQTLFRFADALISADAKCTLDVIRDSMRMGMEVQIFARDVSAHLRSLLLAGICGVEQTAQLLEVTREDAQAYVKQASRTSQARLLHMLDLFLSCEQDMKWSAQPRFALEAAALRACAPEEGLQLDALIRRVDELERRQREGVLPAAQTPPSTQQDETLRALIGRVEELERRQRENALPAAQSAGALAIAQTASSAPQMPAGRAKSAAAPVRAMAAAKARSPVPGDPASVWREVKARLEHDPVIKGILKLGRLGDCEEGHYTLLFPKDTGAPYVNMFNVHGKGAIVADVLTQITGRPCTFRAALEGSVPERDSAVLQAQAQAKAQSDQNFDKIYAAFGRENVRVTDDE